MTTTKIRTKTYEPKPWDAGQLVTFAHIDGTEQIGEVWSAGSRASTAWVAVDGDASTMVLVKKPTAARPARMIDDADDASTVVRVAEAVRAGHGWARGSNDRRVHLDPHCPRSATEIELPLSPVTRETTMFLGGGYWTVTGREHIAAAVIRGDVAYCPRCIG